MADRTVVYALVRYEDLGKLEEHFGHITCVDKELAAGWVIAFWESVAWPDQIVGALPYPGFPFSVMSKMSEAYPAMFIASDGSGPIQSTDALDEGSDRGGRVVPVVPVLTCGSVLWDDLRGPVAHTLGAMRAVSRMAGTAWPFSGQEAPVAPDPVPTVDDVMAAWGVRDLQVRVVSHPNKSFRVEVSSREVDWRERRLSADGCTVPVTRTRFASVIGRGPTHAEALRNALANAAGPWGDLP